MKDNNMNGTILTKRMYLSLHINLNDIPDNATIRIKLATKIKWKILEYRAYDKLNIATRAKLKSYINMQGK
jgi:hypothetical protein